MICKINYFTEFNTSFDDRVQEIYKLMRDFGIFQYRIRKTNQHIDKVQVTEIE